MPANGPFMIVLASLGVILVAVGMYLFRDQVTEKVAQVSPLEITKETSVNITKEDLSNNVILSSSGYFQKFDPQSDSLGRVDEHTADIPGLIYSVLPNNNHDVFFISSSQKVQDESDIYRHYFLNLQKSTLIPFNDNLFKKGGKSGTLYSAIWDQAGDKLLVASLTEVDSGDTNQFMLFSVDANHAKATQLTEAEGDKITLLFVDDKSVIYELRNEQVASAISVDENPEEITYTTEYKIMKYDLNTRQTSTLVDDSSNRLLSVGGTFYTIKDGNQLNFLPLNETQEQFSINLPNQALTGRVIWSPNNRNFALITQDPSLNQQVYFYNAGGNLLSDQNLQAQTDLIFAEDGDAVISEFSVGEDGVSLVKMQKISIDTGDVITNQEFSADSPQIWAWMK